ncbi:MAG: COX15/CtaA family protein [Acidobacteriota bacterium]|nr:COX15/CtaA family protein [Acidobacteriota bacterium]
MTTGPSSPAATRSARRFRSWALRTIGAVYFLILVGGLVRASGAGMGCPDWPTCFGQWIPPTSEAELPADYRETYGEHGYAAVPFNVVKTWTEYINRLIGVAIGLFIFVTLVASWPLKREAAAVFWWSLTAFLLVGFEGWLGSVVVESNLMPWIVTLHMVVALMVVGALLLALARSERDEWSREEIPRDGAVAGLIAGVIGLSGIQILLGTRVREGIDVLMVEAADARGTWMTALGDDVLIHRSVSILVVGANALLVWRLHRLGCAPTRLGRCGRWVLLLLVLEAAVGAGMYYFEVPRALQPVHLLLASIAAGLQLLMAVFYRTGAASPARNSSTVALKAAG